VFEINVDIRGHIELERGFMRFGQSLLENSEMLEELNDEAKNFVNLQFLHQGSYDGFSKWQALSPKYKAWKNKKFPQALGILDLVGDLRRALTIKQSAAHINEIKNTESSYGVRATPLNVVKSNVPMNPFSIPYAIAHQTGIRLPERPFMRIGNKQANEYKKIVVKNLLKKLRNSGYKT